VTKREQVVKVAEKYVAKGRIDAAIKEYLKVLKENPNDVSTLNRLGDLYARISRIDDAVRLFTQIAGQYTEDGFLVKAIAIFKKIIKLDPTRLQVYESLAELYHKQGLTNEARTQYQVLGDYYLKHQDAAAAINIYQKMAELEPDNPSHHLKLAELFQQGQLWDKALRSYRTIAELMLTHGRVEEAVRVYQRAIEVYSDDLGFITDAVLGIKDAGHTGAAAKLLASAVAANPQAEKVARLAGLRPAGASQPGVSHPGTSHPGTSQPSGDGRETLPPPAAPRPQAAAPAPASPPRREPPPPAPAEDEFFLLDIDEPSGSLVMPPADMDQPGTAFQRPAERQPPATSPPGDTDFGADWERPAAAAGPGAEESWGGEGSDASISGFSFQMPDLEVPEMGMEEVEIDLEADALGSDLGGDLGDIDIPGSPAEALEAADDEVLPWQATPEIGEPADAGPARGLSGGESVEFELDLSQLELEPEGADDSLDLPAEPLQLDELAGFEGQPGFELELEADEAAEPEAPAAAYTPAAAAPARPAAPAPPEEPRLQDLLAEAEVFAKYNLEEKALERLDQVLSRDSHHLEALQLFVDLQIKAGDVARVETAVRRLRKAVEERRAPEAWDRVLAKLVRAGMTLSGETVAPIRPQQDDRVSQLIKSLEHPSPAAPRAAAPAAPPAQKKRSVDDALAALTSDMQRPAKTPKPPAARPTPVPPPAAPASPPAATAPPVAPPPKAAPRPAAAPASPPPAAAASAPPRFSSHPSSPVILPPLVPTPPPPVDEWQELAPAAGPVEETLDESRFQEELPDIVLPEERAPMAAPDLDDTGMDWLRDEPTAPRKAPSPDRLFEDEDEFFDLAAELEEELGVEEGKMGGEILAQSEEPTLEEIVEGFKKGVAENLSPEDYDTHYNLGIAYREMGLLDEAIGEFQLAAKDPVHLVDCCSMLGVSFLEKGLPELAVKWYQRGLTAPDLKEEVMLSLLYDMGNVYVAMGDEVAAKKTFVELYGINSNYRDVVAKLEELGR
jgi:tetratricopeptide (TPR) repeat protein